MADTYRSMRGLERTASTSRVLNLAALAVKYADNPEHLAQPLFMAPALNAAVILKHRLRANEAETVWTPNKTATKLIVPFERSDLGLGGRSLFVGERGWIERLQDLAGSQDLGRDANVLEALDELPSLDPFLLREHLKRRGFEVSETHFEISQGDLEMMQAFVGTEISKLIALAYTGSSGGNDANTQRLVEALLCNRTDERLEPLRLTLRLEGDSYREGIFAWKGFLYYKWVLNSLWPKLREVLVELLKVKTVGPRDFENESLIKTMKVRLHDNIELQVRAVADLLRIYDGVFEELTRNGNATAFRDFLLKSPEMLVALGEGTGTISHIASFWRFRFPKGKPLEAAVGEFVDILQDFEQGLGGRAPNLCVAA